jgi:hypothetical protein
MTDPSPSAGTPVIEAVLAALDRLAGDLRRRAEEAESRAAASDERAALERKAREAEAEARHGAEARAVAAERSAREASRRAEAAEATAREGVERLRRDLLAAIGEAVAAAKAAATAADHAAAQGARPDRHSAEQPVDARPLQEDQGGYAWSDDDPRPPWWRRMFSWRRRH